MANSSEVGTGDTIQADQYNDLRDDVLNTSSGHTHSGAVDAGAQLAADSFEWESFPVSKFVSGIIDSSYLGAHGIKIHKRQGGDPSDWRVAGTTNYDVTNEVMFQTVQSEHGIWHATEGNPGGGDGSFKYTRGTVTLAEAFKATNKYIPIGMVIWEDDTTYITDNTNCGIRLYINPADIVLDNGDIIIEYHAETDTGGNMYPPPDEVSVILICLGEKA
jgi:hypothetical protein